MDLVLLQILNLKNKEMKTKYLRAITYDFETGGTDHKVNSVTEFAGVSVNLETLEVIDEVSIMFRPYLDLSECQEESRKEAKKLFQKVSEKDKETKTISLVYGGKNLSLSEIDIIAKDIDNFRENYLLQRAKKDKNRGYFFTFEQYQELLSTEHKNIAELYFKRCYHREAAEITGITIDTLLNEGVEYNDGVKIITDFIDSHKVGNNKPILTGHNIIKFDNFFLEKLYLSVKKDLYKSVNDFMLDTLNFAWLKWTEASAFNLSTCLNQVDIVLKEAHRALHDTRANAKLLIKYIELLRGAGESKKNYKRPKFKINIE